jgi:hypothetical protein
MEKNNDDPKSSMMKKTFDFGGCPEILRYLVAFLGSWKIVQNLVESQVSIIDCFYLQSCHLDF